MTFNTKHNADIVITGTAGKYVIWWKNDVIANADEVGLHLIVRGAIERDLSVYDDVNARWLTGTVDQLDAA